VLPVDRLSRGVDPHPTSTAPGGGTGSRSRLTCSTCGGSARVDHPRRLLPGVGRSPRSRRAAGV